jgi:hypothetical protein
MRMSSTTQVFLLTEPLANLRDKVGEWAKGEWVTPKGYQEKNNAGVVCK